MKKWILFFGCVIFAASIETALGSEESYLRVRRDDNLVDVKAVTDIKINAGTMDVSDDGRGTVTLTALLPTPMVYPGAGIALSTGSAWGTSVANNSANWNTAYGWGNHASAGYLTSATAALTYVPFTGAPTDVDLGSHNLTTTGLGTFGTLKVIPAASTLFEVSSLSLFGVVYPYYKQTANDASNIGIFQGGLYLYDTVPYLYFINSDDPDNMQSWISTLAGTGMRLESFNGGFSFGNSLTSTYPITFNDAGDIATTGLGTFGTGYIGTATNQLRQTFSAVDASSPAYANPGGTGYRIFAITVTTTSGLSNPTKLVNGAIVNGEMSWPATACDGQYIRFDFGAGSYKIITEAKWYQQTAHTHGTWQWQGSNNATDWTNIGGQFTLGGATTQTQTELSGNTTGYRYYRLLGVSGNKTNVPWIQEIEFKIDDYGVIGTLQNYEGATAGGILKLQPSGGATYIGGLKFESSGNLTTSTTFNTGGLISDTDTVFVDNVNHRLGVGLTTPTGNLHSYSATEAQLIVSGWDYVFGAGTYNGAIRFGTTDAYYARITYGTAGINYWNFDHSYNGTGYSQTNFRFRINGTPSTSLSIRDNGIHIPQDSFHLNFGAGDDVYSAYTGTYWDFDIAAATSAIRFNQAQYDTDFIVYGDTGAMLTLDGGTKGASFAGQITSTYAGALSTPYAHYLLNDNAANTAVADNIGAYAGTSIRNTSTMSVAGKINNALTFVSASGDYVNCGDITQFNGATAFSVSAWIKFSSTSGEHGIMGKSNSGTNQRCWNLFQEGAQLLVQVTNTGANWGTGYIQTTNASLSTSVYKLYTIVFDGSQANADRIKIYENGTRLTATVTGTIVTSLSTSTATFNIGDVSGGTILFDGSLDDVRLYNVALTQADINLIYASGTGTETDTLSSLVAPFSILASAAAVVTNLNADLLDGAHVGTSGATIPLLSTANTWTLAQTNTVAPIMSTLTTGRVVFAGASKELVDDADFTFSGDTLTVTKIGSTTMTGTTTHTGSMIVKSVTDAGPMTSTNGTVGEIVFNTSDSKFYGCTVTGTPATWSALN